MTESTTGAPHRRKSTALSINSRRSSSAVVLKPSGSAYYVVVSTPMFWLCWWFVLFLHTATGMFSMVQAVVHLVLSLPSVHINTGGIPVSIELKRVTGISYSIVTLLHLVAIGQIMRASSLGGRLRLRFPTKLPVRSRSRPSRADIPRRTLLHFVRETVALTVGSRGPFAINSTFFSSTLVIREAVEVMLQTYQVWTLSYSVTSVWINTFAVSVVVLNCWSLPLVDWFFKQQEGRRRLMQLVVDMILDFACAVAVPVCVMVPYMVLFDWKIGMFPVDRVRDDIWYANAVSEAKQTLVTSNIDYVSSLLPQYSIFSCLRVLKRLVRRIPSAVTIQSISPSVREDTQRHPDALDSLRPPPPRTPMQKKWERCFLHFLTVCIATWGIVLLAIHVRANTVTLVKVPGCELYSRTWLPSNATCSVQYVNCYRLGVAGEENEVGLSLDRLERSVLSKVVFMHCPRLSIPHQLVEFRWLGAVEIANSTLVSWTAHAAIRQSTHPVLTSINIQCSNLTRIPEGLLHNELPERLMYFFILGSRIPPLPEDIGRLWATSGIIQIRLESTSILSLPDSLSLIPLKRLWITSIGLQDLPDSLFDSLQLISLRVSGNPIARLPSSLDTSVLREFFAEHTNVSSLPEWAERWVAKHQELAPQGAGSFFGSPLCDQPNLTLPQHDAFCKRDWSSQLGRYGDKSEPLKYPL